MKNLFVKKFSRLYGPPLLSGFLLVLSFPNKGFFPLAWVAFVPLLLNITGAGMRDSFKAGFLAGLVYFFGTTYWIYHSLHYYGSISLPLSLILVFLLSAYLSLFPAVFSVLYAANDGKALLPSMFTAPVLWTALEYLRSYALTGFPWSSIGYSQYRFLPFIQVADITGIYGISFLVLAVNGAIVDAILYKRRRAARPLSSVLPVMSGFAILFLALVFTFSYGLYRLNQERPGHGVKAAVVQGNIEQDKKWEPAYQREVIDTYKSLSFAAAHSKPDLVVWPETSTPFFFGKDKPLTEEIVSFQKQLDAYLLLGSVLVKENIGRHVPSPTNSAVLLNKDGNVSYIYDKIHLVPFGEYVPLRGLLFFVDKLVVGIGDYTPGQSYTKAVTPFGSFGTLICYEIIFPGLVRKFYTRGGDFIINITNDAWFGKTDGPYQHFSTAVFRAIENRKPVIRAANTGISGFIDSSGRILGSTGLFQRTFLTKNVKTDGTLTVYTKYGDIFSYLCIVCSLLMLIM